jgi:hypothetical protein
LAALALLLVAAAECGCDSGPKLVKVSGRVLIDGQPLTHGFVRISPAGYRCAMAKLDSQGRFTMSTAPDQVGDGVVIGTHKAAVIATESVGPSSTKWHAPKRYNNEETSELEVTIDKETADLVINLTWEGDPHGKPWTETGEREK